MKKIAAYFLLIGLLIGASSVKAMTVATGASEQAITSSPVESEPNSLPLRSTEGNDAPSSSVPSSKAPDEVPTTRTTTAPSKISLTSPTTEVEVGKTVQLSLVVEPEEATDQTYTYASLTPATASVDANGLVTALSSGDIVISVTSSDNLSSQIKLLAYTLQPVYRVYLPDIRQHHYTTSQNEVTTLVMKNTWEYEGISFFVQDRGSKPVYRLYLPGFNLHLWTRDANERNVLSRSGWQYEGIAWYNSDKGNPVYRAYSPVTNEHLYTSSLNEFNTITSTSNWKKEGVAWYSQEGVKPSNFPTQAILDQSKKNIQKRKDDAKKPKGRPYYYSQLDPRWSNNRFNASTIGPAGCVPTSLAEVLKGCYGMNLTPADVAARMDGYSNQAFGASGRDLIQTANSYGHQVEVVTSEARAKQLLSDGYPLIWFVNVGIGHAVATFGNSNGNTEMYDPYNHMYFNGWYSISRLWSIPSNDSVDWNAGRPVFAIK